MRNKVRLYTEIDGVLVSNFHLCEFESKSGLVMVHPAMLLAAELTRRDMNIESLYGPVAMRITCGLRTNEENKELGKRLGFTDAGGLVAKKSKHLPAFKGIAIDWVAYYTQTGRRVSRKRAAEIAQRYFTYVKADYADGHIHSDVR